MPNRINEGSNPLVTMADFGDLLKSNLIYDRKELCWYEKFNRFGALDPYNNLSFAKEYIFFTKPDCHIFTPNTTTLQPALANDQFFKDAADRYPHVIQQLQKSAGSLDGENTDIVKNPFMVLLSNSVKNTIDFQALSATEMDNSVNMWGSTIPYRKDAWLGDENIDFSLEFEDSRYLEVYMLLLLYEKYERYKTAGLIYPPNVTGATEYGAAHHNFNSYIANKELHDTFGIYRFIVSEDYETIIYYAYICGSYFNSVPRDAFNDLKNGDGLKFSADFKAYCVLDMDPRILYNFNRLVKDAYGTTSNYINLPVYGDIKYGSLEDEFKFAKTLPHQSSSPLKGIPMDRINGNWATFPFVTKEVAGTGIAMNTSAGMSHQYKLKWKVKGNDEDYGEAMDK